MARAKSHAARILGSIEPAANSSRYSASSASGWARTIGALIGRAEVHERGRRVGGHDQHVGADVARQQPAGVVLVDDGLDADELTAGPVRGGDAAAARADHDAAAVEHPLDRAMLEDAQRLRRRHDAPQAVAVGLEHPAAVGGELVGLRGGVERADRLRRIAERRIVGVDLDHREQRRERLVERQPVAELLLDQVADHPLRLRTEHVERRVGHVLVGRLLEREQPDLRAVPVRDHELVVLGDRREPIAGDAARSPAGCRPSWARRAGTARCRRARRRPSSASSHAANTTPTSPRAVGPFVPPPRAHRL